MKKKELLAELEKLGMRPGRGLGQNFLLDGNLLDWIVRRAAPASGEEILEVGPGFGALTERLLASGARVTAVEYDRRLAAYLREKFKTPSLRLVEADACKVDYPFKNVNIQIAQIVDLFVCAICTPTLPLEYI